MTSCAPAHPQADSKPTGPPASSQDEFRAAWISCDPYLPLPRKEHVYRGRKGETIFTRTRRILFISDVALLRQTFGLVLERRTGLCTAQADSPAGGSRLLSDLDGDIALAVVSVDTPGGPDTGLIERLHDLGLPVLAFGMEESKELLTRALEAGANDTISLEAPITHFVAKARQLAALDTAHTNGKTGPANAH